MITIEAYLYISIKIIKLQSPNKISAIILAGGKGSRFKEFDDQKVLFNIGGKPLIQYTTDILKPTIIDHLVFNIAFRANNVISWVNQQRFSHSKISFSKQTEWSIHNALTLAIKKTQSDTIICCNADEIRLGINIQQLIDFHKEHGKKMTIIGAYKSDLIRHRTLEIDNNGLLLSSDYHPNKYINKPEYTGLVNAGIIIFERSVIEEFDEQDLTKGWNTFLVPLCNKGEIMVMPLTNLIFFNVGTPEDLKEALEYFNNL